MLYFGDFLGVSLCLFFALEKFVNADDLISHLAFCHHNSVSLCVFSYK